MGTREDIVSALAEIDGLTVVPFMPLELMADLVAWPEIASVDAGPGWSYQVSWLVQVALSNDLVTAQRQFDELWPVLAQALRSADPGFFVDSIVPGAPLQVGSEVRPLMTITLRSE